jgi:hypothetical protein
MRQHAQQALRGPIARLCLGQQKRPLGYQRPLEGADRRPYSPSLNCTCKGTESETFAQSRRAGEYFIRRASRSTAEPNTPGGFSDVITTPTTSPVSLICKVALTVPSWPRCGYARSMLNGRNLRAWVAASVHEGGGGGGGGAAVKEAVTVTRPPATGSQPRTAASYRRPRAAPSKELSNWPLPLRSVKLTLEALPVASTITSADARPDPAPAGGS